MHRQPAVYILASARNGTLYIGVTSDLVTRVWQHCEHITKGFTDQYGVTRLVWYELHETMESAILREKRIKKWRRLDKVAMIESFNRYWTDLWEHIAR